MKETTNREQDRLLREAMGRREGDADGVQGDLDDLLRKALERRAERAPALSDDFQDRVMARIRPLANSPRGEEGRGQRRWWMVSPAIGVAAAVVVGLFFLWQEPKGGANGFDGHDKPAARVVAAAGERPGGEAATPVGREETSAGKPPTTLPLVAEAPAPAPSQQGRVGGGAPGRTEGKPAKRAGGRAAGKAGGKPAKRVGGDPVPAASVADLYATIDLMTDQALRDAERLAIETLSRNVAADTPS